MGKPDEYNPTNNDIRKHHETQEDRDTPTRGAAPPENRYTFTRAAPFSKPVNVDDTTISHSSPSQAQKHGHQDTDEYNPTNDDIRKHHETQEDRGTPTRGAAPPENRYTYTRAAPSKPVNVDDTTVSHSSPSQVQRHVHLDKFYSEKEPIQPEVWPTKKEFQLAKKKIQYDPEKLHFAVCGGSGTGKSSLINAFRGLKNNNSQAAHTGVDETTTVITRYPDPREELPYKRLVWYDCPGAGTLKIPGWQYFNQQGLFIFDIIILVYDTVIIYPFFNLFTAD